MDKRYAKRFALLLKLVSGIIGTIAATVQIIDFVTKL